MINHSGSIPVIYFKQGNNTFGIFEVDEKAR